MGGATNAVRCATEWREWGPRALEARASSLDRLPDGEAYAPTPLAIGRVLDDVSRGECIAHQVAERIVFQARHIAARGDGAPLSRRGVGVARVAGRLMPKAQQPVLGVIDRAVGGWPPRRGTTSPAVGTAAFFA